jgi:pyruvate,water dikinase
MERTLTGTRAVASSVRGEAVVLKSFKAWRDVPLGAIVVAGAATPDAVLVMERAGGLVFETGGPACHAAILARELGLPCVVGVAGATELIRDGDRVTIDGARGEVHVLGR